MEFKISQEGMENLQSFQISRDGTIYNDTKTIGEGITVVALGSESEVCIGASNNDGSSSNDGGSNNDDFNGEIPTSSSPVLPGKWYLTFVFFFGSWLTI